MLSVILAFALTAGELAGSIVHSTKSGKDLLRFASHPFAFSPWKQALPALALALFLGPIEEFGWRGLALPLLQRRFAPSGPA